MRKWILSALIVTGAICGFAQKHNDLQQLQKFTQFYNYLTRSYLDTINSPKLIEGAITKMLSELDPHSSYIGADEMKSEEEKLNANFEGIGIEFYILNDTVIVVNTIPGGPSEKAGLMPNDRIIRIDMESVVGFKQAQVPEVLRGPKGSTVNISVVRRGVNKPIEFRIVRDRIPMHTVDAVFMLDDKTGYIKINRFAATTGKEVKAGLKKLAGMESLVLDLRGNGGGFLDQAVEVCSNFLEKGSLVVYMEGRSIPTQKFNSNGNPSFGKGKITVLVDEFSASASEIVAGAIQDWDRGLIIGRPTFGKGLVQRQFSLVDGSAVRVTIARYHTPTGRVIQRPYENGDSKAYYENFSNRIKTSDSITVKDSTEIYKTMRNGRTVFGGGGISPDITVKRDTASLSAYRAALRSKGVITEFAVDYLDKNRSSLNRLYPTPETYIAGFEITDDILAGIVALGENRGVRFNETGYNRSKKSLKKELKSLIAQKLWDVAEYYRVMIGIGDDDVSKALEVIENWDTYGEGVFN